MVHLRVYGHRLHVHVWPLTACMNKSVQVELHNHAKSLKQLNKVVAVVMHIGFVLDAVADDVFLHHVRHEVARKRNERVLELLEVDRMGPQLDRLSDSHIRETQLVQPAIHAHALPLVFVIPVTPRSDNAGRAYGRRKNVSTADNAGGH